MSTFEGHFSGVFLSDKSKIEEAKQLFDCLGFESEEYWETADEYYSLKDSGLDFITKKNIRNFELLNRLLGKTYVIRGDYESNNTVDSVYKKIVCQNPFDMKESFTIRDFCYGDGESFYQGTPYYEYFKTLQRLASEAGIDAKWSLLEPEDDWYDEDYDDEEEGEEGGINYAYELSVIPDPNDIKFCNFCKKYVTLFDNEAGEAAGQFPITLGVPDKEAVEKLLPIAKEKGYAKLVVILEEYLEGKTHESEGEAIYRGIL